MLVSLVHTYFFHCFIYLYFCLCALCYLILSSVFIHLTQSFLSTVNGHLLRGHDILFLLNYLPD